MPSDALLAVYALVQLAKAVQDTMAASEGLTEDQLAEAYRTQGEQLRAAVDRWKAQGNH